MAGEWAIVAAAGVSAVASGGTAYLVSRLQVRSEAERHRRELDKLRAASDEEHLRHREGVYTDFLKSAYRVSAHGGFVEDPDGLSMWSQQFEQCLASVNLVGDREVREAVLDVETHATTAVVNPMRGQIADPKTRGQAILRLRAAWQKTAAAMRKDLGRD